MAEVLELKELKTASRQDYHTLTTDLTGHLFVPRSAANVKIIAPPYPPYTPIVIKITDSDQIGRC